MKIAIPTTNDMLDEHFGHCHQFTFFKVENDEVTGWAYEDAPPHQPGLLPSWLAQRAVTDVITGGIGQKAIQLFNQLEINVYSGAPRLTPEEIITGFLANEIEFRANCCDHPKSTCK